MLINPYAQGVVNLIIEALSFYILLFIYLAVDDD